MWEQSWSHSCVAGDGSELSNATILGYRRVDAAIKMDLEPPMSLSVCA